MAILTLGLTDKVEHHRHGTKYDAAEGTGRTSTSAGHSHEIKDYKIMPCAADLHVHEHIRTADLNDSQRILADAMDAIESQDKSESRAARLERCVLKLKASGKSKSSAFAICNASLNKAEGKPARKPDDEAQEDVGPGAGMGPGGKCVCPKCGAKVAHKIGQPCAGMKCPKCGTTMTRSPGKDNEEEEEDAGKAPKMEDIVEYFNKNHNPSDEDFHDWCEEEGYSVDEAEVLAYQLATTTARARMNGMHAKNKYDAHTLPKDILKLGMDVEKEHSDDPESQIQIVGDHGAEYMKNGKVDPEDVRAYYVGLITMEAAIKGKKSKS